MRARMSASCFWLSALVSALAKCASGIVAMSRCGLAKAPACGMATCEWMSMVVLFGLISRPGLPCLRAAVRSYLFHCVVIAVPWFPERCREAVARSEHAELLGDHGVVDLDLASGSGEHHLPGIDDDHVVGEVECELDVLLDEHDRLPFGLELRDGAADLGDELRREPLGRLVHQQHARIAHERAPDREHLLLAAGERARDLGVTLLQPRKQLEYALERPAGTAAGGLRALRRHHQVLAHGQ